MPEAKEPSVIVQARQSALSLIATIGAALAAVLAPIALAIVVASQEVTKAEFHRIEGYAYDVLRRSEGTSEQILAGINQIAALNSNHGCSPGIVAAMRNIDLSSSYIQAVGRVENEQLVCSSLGLAGPTTSLGPVDIVQSSGVLLRTNVQFPFAPGSSFLVAESNGYAAIIHKDLPIDTALDEPEVTLASFSQSAMAVLTQRGTIGADWIEYSRESGETHFVRDDFLVVVLLSERFQLGAIAAVPVTELNARIRNVAFIALPVGLLAGAIFGIALLRIAAQQRSLPNLVRAGLRRDEFHREYQPIVSLEEERGVGAEALMRWTRGKENIRPDVFIPAAEEAGMIQEITRRVIGLASVDAAGLFKEFPLLHLGINLAPADLADRETLRLIDHLTEATGARSGNLLVEATERGLTDPETAGPNIRKLRMSGIAVAVDDFGTGYSNLATLQALELDYLKIDKSFIDTLGRGAATSSVVEHIIEMGKSLNLKMIAEGVETVEQARMLRELGVQYAQGWLYARPMPYQQFISQLRQKRDRMG